MDETWAGSLLQGFIDDGGFCYTATQRGDGAAPPEDRAVPAASQQLRGALLGRDDGAAGDGPATDLRPAPALPAVQSQAVQQAPAAPAQWRSGRAESARRRRRNRRGARGERGHDGGAEQEQHPGEWAHPQVSLKINISSWRVQTRDNSTDTEESLFIHQCHSTRFYKHS